MIALDIAQHFKDKVRPNGFKAQVVAPGRSAALRYTEQLRSFGLSAYPIITINNNDGAEYQIAREIDQEQITNAFVDPEGEPEILVVVDMLLTGFDAPVEQVLYLDRPLREHGLLQAIARVNRRFSHEKDGTPTEKGHGLVVDYCGISHDLEQALASFEWNDVQDTMQALEEDPATVIDAAAVQAESHFRGLDLGNTWACVLMFAPDANTEGNYKADLFERFNADYRQFSRLMDRLLPDPRGLPYVDRLARLTLIRSYIRAHFLRENAGVNWTDIGTKVKQLIDQRISAEVRQMMQPVSILDQDFEREDSSPAPRRGSSIGYGARHPRPDSRAAGAEPGLLRTSLPAPRPHHRADARPAHRRRRSLPPDGRPTEGGPWRGQRGRPARPVAGVPGDLRDPTGTVRRGS